MVSPELPVKIRLLLEQFKIDRVIVRDKEDILAVVPALSNMVGLAWYNDPCNSWQGDLLPATCAPRQARK